MLAELSESGGLKANNCRGLAVGPVRGQKYEYFLEAAITLLLEWADDEDSVFYAHLNEKVEKKASVLEPRTHERFKGEKWSRYERYEDCRIVDAFITELVRSHASLSVAGGARMLSDRLLVISAALL